MIHVCRIALLLFILTAKTTVKLCRSEELLVAKRQAQFLQHSPPAFRYRIGEKFVFWPAPVNNVPLVHRVCSSEKIQGQSFTVYELKNVLTGEGDIGIASEWLMLETFVVSTSKDVTTTNSLAGLKLLLTLKR